MAGDRGLAFVVIGLIGVSIFSLNARQNPTHNSNPTSDVRSLARAARNPLTATGTLKLAVERAGAVRQLVSQECRSIDSQLHNLVAPSFDFAGDMSRRDRAVYDYLARLPDTVTGRSYISYSLAPERWADRGQQPEQMVGVYPELKHLGRGEGFTERLLLVGDAAQAADAPPIE